jgi:hypothetical protein
MTLSLQLLETKPSTRPWNLESICGLGKSIGPDGNRNPKFLGIGDVLAEPRLFHQEALSNPAAQTKEEGEQNQGHHPGIERAVQRTVPDIPRQWAVDCEESLLAHSLPWMLRW